MKSHITFAALDYKKEPLTYSSENVEVNG